MGLEECQFLARKVFAACILVLAAGTAYGDAKILVVPVDYPTIQAAIDAAQPGDTVLVKAGRYKETLAFKTGITLRGEDRNSVTIHCDFRQGPALRAVDCNGGWISDLTFEHTGVEDATSDDDDLPPVLEIESSMVNIVHCIVQDSGEYGIILQEGSASVVEDCIIRRCAACGIGVRNEGSPAKLKNNRCAQNGRTGIAAYREGVIVAEGNVCTKNGANGIRVIGEGTEATLRNNRCTDNGRRGIMFWDGARGVAEDNTSRKNGESGIAVIGEATEVTLLRNRSFKNKKDGIVVALGSTVTAAENVCGKNLKNGIFARGKETHATLEHNQCSDNKNYGIYIGAGADGVVLGNSSVHNKWAGIGVSHLFTTATIEGNQCHENEGNGISIGKGGQARLERNACDGNRWCGIRVGGEGTTAFAVENECTGNGMDGVHFQKGAGGTAQRNICTGNQGYGIHVLGRDSAPTLDGNTLTDNDQGNFIHDDLPAGADQYERIDRVQIGWLLEAEQFDHLEAIAARLREEKSRFRNGEWQLQYFYDYLEDGSWKVPAYEQEEYLAALTQWGEAYPESQTQRVALARAYIDFAWQARGGGWASEVTEEGWKGFRKNLPIAWDMLKKAEEEGVRDPELYASLITAGKGLGKPARQMHAAFEKGLALEPTYYDLCYNQASDLLPRWHGDYGDVERFARRAVTLTGSLEGDTLYARIAAYVRRREGNATFLHRHGFSYPQMERGFVDILESYPEADYCRNSYCLIACLYEDQETAAVLFPQIESDWDKTVWEDEESFQKWKDWVSGHGEYPESEVLDTSESPFTTEVNLFLILLIMFVPAGFLLLLLIGSLIVMFYVMRQKADTTNA